MHEHSSVQYASIDHAIKRSGVGSYLAKTDIKVLSGFYPFILKIFIF